MPRRAIPFGANDLIWCDSAEALDSQLLTSNHLDDSLLLLMHR
jgi:hypothetical protein